MVLSAASAGISVASCATVTCTSVVIASARFSFAFFIATTIIKNAIKDNTEYWKEA